MEKALPAAANRKLKVGVLGLGRAFSLMLPTLTRDPRVALAAAADLRPQARARFASDFGASVHETAEALCADPAVEVVYVATPHQHHAAHAVLAARHGKHVLVEKPIALTLADCDAMIEAARQAGVALIVGHSHSFDAPIARTRELIASGAFGKVRMITALNFTDYLYRPRRPEELDTAQGGGAIFNQAAHQVDTVRLLADAPVTSVRAVTGAWDAQRNTEGAYAALLTFEDGMFASLTYNGYGHFDSDEFQGWIGEMGRRKTPGAKPRRTFADAKAEASFKDDRNYGGAAYVPQPNENLAHQHFGTIIVSCERADLRPRPDGVAIYENGSLRIDPLPPPNVPRSEVIDELWSAVVERHPPLHDGVWARATLEVCLTILRSSRERRDVALSGMHAR